MSEYQCYEFVALDRPLTADEIAELRAISTRAEISSTRFWNEYHWGDLGAEPGELLARYFDAFLYFANWPSRRFMLRLPAKRVDSRRLKPYFPGGPSRLTRTGKHVILDLWNDFDEPEYDTFEQSASLEALVPLRAKLLRGDVSLAWLAWLLAVQAGEVADSAKEPPVPAGLGAADGSFFALADFLRIDPELLAAAAEGVPEDPVDMEVLRDWIRSRPEDEKDRWLYDAIDDPAAPIGDALIAAFQRAQPAKRRKRRTVGELLARAEALGK